MPLSGLLEFSLWLSFSVFEDRGVGGGGIVETEGVVVAVELPALVNCLAFRSVMGFPAAIAWDQFLISWAVSTSNRAPKVCSTAILFLSIESA